jgi:hypothetical protein
MSGTDPSAAHGTREPSAQGSAGQLAETRYGPVRVLFGAHGGRYPDGNSLLVVGTRETLIIDPALGVIPRRAGLPPVHRVLHSHCHEDHIAGNHLFRDVPWHFHEADLPGIASLDAMMAIYGMDDATDSFFRKALEEQFHFTPRADAVAFRGGDRFDLGGVSLEVIHTPGHTRGHSCFRIEWREEMEADWYATFHHIGVVEGRADFLARLERFAGVIDRREARLLEYLHKPRTLDEVVAHRFVYRAGDPVPFADAVERRSMAQHIARLLAAGRVREEPEGRYRASRGPERVIE